MTSVQFSSGLALHRYDVCTLQCRPRTSTLWRLLTTLQAPLINEKKGVRFSALYLQKKRNLLIYGHSHQQVHALSVLILFSSGSAHIGVFYYSLIQPKLAFDRHMQFLRGGKGE